jgi:uncharacterized membrane protein YkvI
VQQSAPASTWFQRFLLPGFAFKAVIIGGGYATGRELAEFFMPSGPVGGLLGMALATVIWSAVAALTFALARLLDAYDYRSFFAGLLGRFWVVFEAAYIGFVILILAVFGAAAGAIGEALFGWPPLAGTTLLALSIIAFVTFGTGSVEQLFKYVSFLLYGVYALFLVLALARFGDRIPDGFAHGIGQGWALGGVTYASYNIIGAVVILPVLRHLTSRRDAVVAGLVAGPLAMIPAILFFICMVAYYPGIERETLPSDFLLRQLSIPFFHYLFQVMIFSALLESGTGAVHAINERLSRSWEAKRGRAFGRSPRAAIAGLLLLVCMYLADRIGLVALIAQGYRALALIFLTVYVVPLLTLGVLRLRKGGEPEDMAHARLPARP